MASATQQGWRCKGTAYRVDKCFRPLSDPPTFSLRLPFFFPVTPLTPTFRFSFQSNPARLPCFLATPNKLLAITSLADSQYAILSYK